MSRRSLLAATLLLAACDPNIPIGALPPDAAAPPPCTAGSDGGARSDGGLGASGWSERQGALFAIAGGASGPVFVAGEGGVILRSDDGTSFAAEPSGTRDAITGLWRADDGELFASTAGGDVLRSFGDGSWRVDGHTQGALHGVWGRTPADVWAVGAEGAVLHRDGSGGWQRVPVGVSVDLEAAWGTAPGSSGRPTVYLVGAHGTALTVDDSGMRGSLALGSSAHLRAVFGDVSGATGGAGAIWIVGDGVVYRALDGHSFRVQPIGDGKRLYDVVALAPSDVWLVGAGGTLLHGGGDAGWRAEPVATTADLHALFASPQLGLFVVGDRGLILHHD